MCESCGCSGDGQTSFRQPGKNKDDHQHKHDHAHENNEHKHSHNHEHHGHSHHHDHKHPHDHGHTHNEHLHPHKQEYTDHDSHKHTISLESEILGQNKILAERNRGYFEAKGIRTLNLVSSPCSGKTSLLERTIREMKSNLNIYVIEGDQQTMNDAERIKAAGAPVLQINTGNGCHLDADMISKAIKQLDVKENSLLIIENVGNLVCPALFDLGESARVVVISVTEGEDKPLKYPNMFATSQLCIINKTDLLPYLDFNIAKAKEYALRINHHLQFIELSVRTGDGMNAWYQWLEAKS